jgi:acyl-CoA dehydrogenase
MALQVVDRAMQAFGAEGVSQDQDLARVYAGLRTLRYADVSPSFPDTHEYES